MGCVSYSRAYFPDGKIAAAHFDRAHERAATEVTHIRKQFRSKNWAECVGSSGTLNAIAGILAANGWSEGEIHRKGLDKLRKRMLKFDSFDDIAIEGLADKVIEAVKGGAIKRFVVMAGCDGRHKTRAYFTELAEQLLGWRYAVTGRVMHGQKLGRQLGVPTANVRMHRYPCPLRGVFAAWAHFDGQCLPAVCNVGLRPTVHGRLPVLEALACGTPALCSQASSLPEIGGPAARYFDPYDVEAMTAALREVWTRPELRAEMRRQGLARAASFSWERAAMTTWAPAPARSLAVSKPSPTPFRRLAYGTRSRLSNLRLSPSVTPP